MADNWWDDPNRNPLMAAWMSLPPEARDSYKSAVGLLGELSPGAAVRDAVDSSGEIMGGLLSGDLGKAGSGAAGMALAAAGLIPGGRAARIASKEAAPIRAYHGSPHDFDRFDMSKIGTGEGAQAYGHGLYFAENEDVARGYRDTLARKFAKVNWDGSTITTPSEWSAMTRALEDSGDWRSAKLANHYANLGGTTDYRLKQLTDWYRDQPEMMAALDRMRQRINVAPEQGKMYEVAIHADPQRFLDWDKPLSAQPPGAAKALRDLGYKADTEGMRAFDDALLSALTTDAKVVLPRQPSDPLGQEIYRRTSRETYPIRKDKNSLWEGTGARTYDEALAMVGGDKSRVNRLRNSNPIESAEVLRDAGIPGIKYLDGGSRGAGAGSSNYVAFDDKIIEILRKYGILAPVAGAGAVGAATVPGLLDTQEAY